MDEAKLGYGSYPLGRKQHQIIARVNSITELEDITRRKVRKAHTRIQKTKQRIVQDVSRLMCYQSPRRDTFIMLELPP